MNAHDRDIDERTRLAGTNKFELLLFRLGDSPSTGERELYGINVFKVREVLVMPKITALANSQEHLMGVANIRGQIIPVINLSAVVGCKPQKGLSILMVTEFGRTVQGFAVEDVREIVRLDWDQVLPAEGAHAGALVTGIARLDGTNPNTRLAQVLDVEQVLRDVTPVTKEEITKEVVGSEPLLPPGTSILVADDSHVARAVIELGLNAMDASFVMTRTGRQAWDYLDQLGKQAKEEGFRVCDKIAVVLTDLEMPEMDGFTLTKLIKSDTRFKGIPVVIHSSLTGSTNENHVKTVGADGYVAKFSPRELAATLRKVLA
ncbi:chemotaxis protein CheV [Rhodoferax lithotrophicus]|uniref:Chemotaxis protein CheV n=1 Tax=Rhodoferax lithotrophicus TaxID=2798804 RepID=A0ABN6DEY8_9BURK|nr:chemotaxis protein [Rhodoferax sp. MIZ03]BCO29391.1 chemotaxis protein CheV [Rhodoferax sp. MIZ03]